MEERKSKLDTLWNHLAQGTNQTESGELVDNFTRDSLIMTWITKLDAWIQSHPKSTG
jgi:hypothetical protein